MHTSIRVFRDNDAWTVDDPLGGALSFATGNEAFAAAALLADDYGCPVEALASDDTNDS
jgi:hypothetical protein